jgi:hypothetical protein
MSARRTFICQVLYSLYNTWQDGKSGREPYPPLQLLDHEVGRDAEKRGAECVTVVFRPRAALWWFSRVEPAAQR